jgi:hypothetical protein
MGNIKTTTMIKKFLRYSTGGHQFKERTIRIWTIILIPIWTLGLIFTIIFTIEGIEAIPLYFKAKNLIPKQVELDNTVQRNQYQANDFSQDYQFDPEPWIEIGIKNPSPFDTMMLCKLPHFFVPIKSIKFVQVFSFIGYGLYVIANI